jgi:hypothetical protein
VSGDWRTGDARDVGAAWILLGLFLELYPKQYRYSF